MAEEEEEDEDDRIFKNSSFWSGSDSPVVKGGRKSLWTDNKLKGKDSHIINKHVFFLNIIYCETSDRFTLNNLISKVNKCKYQKNEKM